MNLWINEKQGNYTYRRNITNNQLLAKYVVLGADLRELYENFDKPEARTMLDEIIQQHESIMINE